jgi:hypothetical protein
MPRPLSDQHNSGTVSWGKMPKTLEKWQSFKMTIYIVYDRKILFFLSK